MNSISIKVESASSAVLARELLFAKQKESLLLSTVGAVVDHVQKNIELSFIFLWFCAVLEVIGSEKTEFCSVLKTIMSLICSEPVLFYFEVVSSPTDQLHLYLRLYINYFPSSYPHSHVDREVRFGLSQFV